MGDPTTRSGSSDEKLPIDVRTFLLSLWRRRFLLLAILLVSGLLGVAGGVLLGRRTYEAETVLLYKPMTEIKNISAIPSVATYVGMVKIQSSLEDMNRRLGLDSPPKTLDRACDVVTEKNSDLMIIRARGRTGRQAADMANTLRDLFLENQKNTRRSEATKQVHDLEARLEAVKQQLATADAALHKFTTTNKVVNLDKEAQSYLDQLAALDLQYENAKIEKTAVDQKAANLDKISADLRRRVEAEQAANAQDTQKLYEMNIRIERLRDAIHEDQNVRAAMADLAQKELDLDHAKKLKAEGVISQVEFEKAQNAWEKQKALAVDTQKIKEWRAEMDKLHKSVLPADASTSTMAPVLKEIMVKSFDIQLERAAITEKSKSLETARDRIKSKLEALPQLQREFVELTREVSVREAERQSIENLLSQVRRVSESETADFGVVSNATPPARPLRSTRKLLCLGIAVAGTFLGFAVVIALELLDTRIRSGSEFALKLPIALLGVVPKVSAGPSLFPENGDFAPLEQFRTIARRVRVAIDKKGARILIVSAQHGEGRSVVAANLASCYGRQDERVLVVDAQLRPVTGQHDLRGLIAEAEGPVTGLGEYLSFKVEKPSEVIWPTFLPGVACLPRVGTETVPDLLGSNRMRELFAEASAQYGLILVEVPPLLRYADAEALASCADAVLFVVRASTCRSAVLRKALDRLTASKVPVIGAILNGVDALYLEHK